jgi:molecular chaperone GrpE
MMKRQKKNKDIKTEQNAIKAVTTEDKKIDDTEQNSAAETPCAPEVQAKEDEISRLKNQYIRLMADFDNYRKRQVREREEYIKRSNEQLLGDILPVVDHLEMALQKVDDQDDPFVSGIKLVYDQFIAVLKRCGMEPVEAHGKEFNPEMHEAISYIPSLNVPANRVIDQLRCGWLLSGHLMRAAQVIVSSGQPAESDAENVSD